MISSLDALTVALGEQAIDHRNLEMIDTKDNQAPPCGQKCCCLVLPDVNTIDGMKEVIRR
ncbi:MAG: hypothetical protein IPP49_09530 [Saprospiraceae bacterium]|nr:hypothetical protein [Saprospiraceae bacterium]